MNGHSMAIIDGHTLKSSWTTASTMGIIMAVVAVLEIHMERNMVTNMNPKSNLKTGSY